MHFIIHCYHKYQEKQLQLFINLLSLKGRKAFGHPAGKALNIYDTSEKKICCQAADFFLLEII